MKAGARPFLQAVLAASALLGVVAAEPATPAQAATPAPAATPAQASTPAQAATPAIGISVDWIDQTVSPRQDLFDYANGHWLKTHPIPADRAVYGIDALTQENTEAQLRTLVEQLAADPALDPGSEEGKVAMLYRDFMDVAAADQRGVAPVQRMLTSIAGLHDRRQLARLFADLGMAGVIVPIGYGTAQDERDSSRYLVHVGQSGLSLPDRDYYLDRKDARFAKVRSAYVSYMAGLLRRAGQPDAVRAARQVMAFETAIARLQWTKVENRDPVKTYNARNLTQLQALMPHLDWVALFTGEGLPADPGTVVVGQPGFLQGLDRLLTSTPLPVLRNALRVQVMRAAAPFLDQDLAARSVAFESGVLRGIPEERPRWKRALALVEQSMGEALGKRYVAAHFPATARLAIQDLVDHLVLAYRDSIQQLDWLEPATRAAALDKLTHIRAKLGYPDQWRDYRALQLVPGDLFGNVQRARAFETLRENHRLREPVDRMEWDMTPQTVNAYYNPTQNEIVFPAAQLQAPYFDAQADAASNYGNIGFVIGHELSHAFDDEGSQFDAQGNLRDWWTAADHARFSQRTAAMVAQYGALDGVPGIKVNGALTLGENIADNVGLTIAWRAYQASLAGHEAPVIGGLTGAQRFFIAYAQSWMGKEREEERVKHLKSDPHAPLDLRTNQTVRNQDAFHAAFGTQPGDQEWLAPADRVRLW